MLAWRVSSEEEEVSGAFVSSSALQVGIFKDVQELNRKKKVNVHAYIEHNLNTNDPLFFFQAPAGRRETGSGGQVQHQRRQ